MANTKQAAKRAKQSLKHRGANVRLRTTLRTAIKKVTKAIESGEFKKLPGGIYNTAYIRQYCRAIDFDEYILLGFYYQAVGLQPGDGPAVSEAALQRYLQTLQPAPARS